MESYIEELRSVLAGLEKDKISKLSEKILQARNTDHAVYIIGNGGSASTASHMACDLGKGTVKELHNDGEKRLKVASLMDNTAMISALANDLHYDEIFSQQLSNLIKKDDILIVITGSGKSKNVIKGIQTAKKAGAYVFSLLGFNGGEVLKISDDYLLIPSQNYGIIEDVHLTINHLLVEAIKQDKNLVA